MTHKQILEVLEATAGVLGENGWFRRAEDVYEVAQQLRQEWAKEKGPSEEGP